MNCPFCQIPEDKIIGENQHFYAIWDIHPISQGHCLIISKRHAEDFFALTPEEASSLHELAQEVRELLAAKYQPKGFNLLMNCGVSAGQSVFHFHLHIMPSYGGVMSGLKNIGRSLMQKFSGAL